MPDNPLPGGGQEVPRLRHPQRDDGHLEVPEQRLHARRVHQHLPQRQGDRDSLRGRGQEAGQISASVLCPCPPPPIIHSSTLVASSFPHIPYTLPPSAGTDVLIHEKERKKKKKNWTSFPSPITYSDPPPHPTSPPCMNPSPPTPPPAILRFL